MTESRPQPDARWEDRVLARLGFMGWRWPKSAAQLAFTIAAVLVLVFVRSLPIALGLVLLALAAVYWTAFWTKVVRSFRDGYRS